VHRGFTGFLYTISFWPSLSGAKTGLIPANVRPRCPWATIGPYMYAYSPVSFSFDFRAGLFGDCVAHRRRANCSASIRPSNFFHPSVSRASKKIFAMCLRIAGQHQACFVVASRITFLPCAFGSWPRPRVHWFFTNGYKEKKSPAISGFFFSSIGPDGLWHGLRKARAPIIRLPPCITRWLLNRARNLFYPRWEQSQHRIWAMPRLAGAWPRVLTCSAVCFGFPHFFRPSPSLVSLNRSLHSP